jgi:hypothetical protein
MRWKTGLSLELITRRWYDIIRITLRDTPQHTIDRGGGG